MSRKLIATRCRPPLAATLMAPMVRPSRSLPHGADDVAGVERPAPSREPCAPRAPAALPGVGPVRLQRQADPERALDHLAQHAVPEARHHPVAVGATYGEPGLTHA